MLEHLLNDFDRAWRSGVAPNLEEYLARVEPSGRTEALAELILIDLEYRWRTYAVERHPAGASPVTEPVPDTGSIPACPLLDNYAVQFPALGDSSAWSTELIGAEYFARRRWGDGPTAEEYLRRF